MLNIIGVTKAYPKVTALADFSLEMEPGVYGLLGPNGAGKSTLMNIIAGVLLPTSGKITYSGKNIYELGMDYRALLGYLPQVSGFYPSYTAIEFLQYMAKIKGVEKSKIMTKIDEVLVSVNLQDNAKQKIKEYSGGMKQRLGIAQAIINDPKILILDEPTAGLDPKERIRFRNIISRSGSDKIVILATHIVTDIESIAKNILIQKKGQLIKNGNLHELLDDVRGKVYSVSVPDEIAADYISNYKISNITKEDDINKIRFISDEAVPDAATAIEPTLEDVYLYHFGEAGM